MPSNSKLKLVLFICIALPKLDKAIQQGHIFEQSDKTSDIVAIMWARLQHIEELKSRYQVVVTF